MSEDDYFGIKVAVERMKDFKKEYKLIIKKIELAIGSGLISRDLDVFKRLLKETQKNLKECEEDISYWQDWLKQHTH